MIRPVGAKHLEAILIAGFSIVLSGCVMSGKPATAVATPPAPKPVPVPASPPPTPPAPLSIPQTRAELPAPQPITLEAQNSAEPSDEPPPPPPSPPKKGRPATPRPKPAETTPAGAPPVAAPVATEPEPRAPIQEIIPADELNRLRVNANARKDEIRQRLDRVPHRGLTKQQRDLVENVKSFLRLSEEAERTGDMRKANEFAERGAVLAQGLPGAR